jgi:hypothetical protein
MYYEKSEDRILEAKPVVYDGAMVVFNPKFFEDVGKIPGIMSTEWYREGRDMALNKTRILVRAESDSPDWRLLCGDRLVGRTWGVSKRGFGTFQLAKEIKVPLLLPVQSAPEEQPAGKKPTEEAAKTTAKQLDETLEGRSRKSWLRTRPRKRKRKCRRRRICCQRFWSP